MPTSFAEQASAGMRLSRAKSEPQMECRRRGTEISQLNSPSKAHGRGHDLCTLLIAAACASVGKSASK